MIKKQYAKLYTEWTVNFVKINTVIETRLKFNLAKDA